MSGIALQQLWNEAMRCFPCLVPIVRKRALGSSPQRYLLEFGGGLALHDRAYRLKIQIGHRRGILCLALKTCLK